MPSRVNPTQQRVRECVLVRVFMACSDGRTCAHTEATFEHAAPRGRHRWSPGRGRRGYHRDRRRRGLVRLVYPPGIESLQAYQLMLDAASLTAVQPRPVTGRITAATARPSTPAYFAPCSRRADQRARNAPVPSTRRAQRPEASLPAYLAPSLSHIRSDANTQYSAAQYGWAEGSGRRSAAIRRCKKRS